VAHEDAGDGKLTRVSLSEVGDTAVTSVSLSESATTRVYRIVSLTFKKQK